MAYIQEHAGEFNGVTVDERTERQYPYGTTACHVLGYTSTITQEQLDAQSEDGDSAGTIDYQSGDVVGQAGVESRYERLLQGIRGEQTVTVDAQGNVLGQAGSVPASPGSDIKLTLDLTIQQACETGLQHAIDTAKNAGYENAGNGACLCLDCTNGEILGMASAPTFDPSVFVGGVSSDVWSQLNSEDGGRPLLNRAIGGQYMSASTIKPLSALAATVEDLPDDFAELVKERERIAPTAFGNLVALPHPMRAVSARTFVAVGLLDEPVTWAGHEVWGVFLISLATERDLDLSAFYHTLLRVLMDTDAVRELLDDRRFETLLALVRRQQRREVGSV